MTEPRTRTAAEVAAAAGNVVVDIHCGALIRGGVPGSEPATLTQIRVLTRFVEDIAYLVEDLAAVVAAQDKRLADVENGFAWSPEVSPSDIDPATLELFPPVAWPLEFKCEVSDDILRVSGTVGGDIIVQAASKRGDVASAVLSANSARHLAHAILAKLGGE